MPFDDGYSHLLVLILLASSILQFAAAFLALRLIRFTHKRLAWMLIAAAIVGMAVRRLLGLAHSMPEIPTTRDFAFEWTGLAVSALLLAGVAGLKPLFKSIRDNADKLARSQAMYKELVENAHSLIIRISTDGLITFANDYACRFLGYEPGELVGRKMMDTILPPRDAQDRDMGRIVEEFLGQSEDVTRRVEGENRRKDGSPVWVSWGVTPIPGRGGARREFLCVGMDIGDRKEKERLRENVQNILRHDLKSPLAGLIACCSMLQGGENLTPDQAEALQAMEEQGTRLLEMVNRYMDIYKLEAGLYTIEPAPVDIAAVARGVAASQTRLANTAVPIAITVDGRPDTPDTQVAIQGDEMLLYGMLTNLVRNALEASDREEPVDIRLTTAPGGVSIAVHNRQAVPEDFRERFFEKYATQGKRFGTGLGTYSAKLFAEAHNGTIALDTNDRDGTTVTVRLPADPLRADLDSVPS